jgi:hypothetical protein
MSASPQEFAETVDGSATPAHDDKRPADHYWPGTTSPMWYGNNKSPVGFLPDHVLAGILQRASRFEVTLDFAATTILAKPP